MQTARKFTLWRAFIEQHSSFKTRSSYQEVDWLNDVQEDFILPVLDALWPPGHSVGDGGGGSWGACVKLVSLLSYVSARETKGNTNIKVNHSEKGKPTVLATSQKAARNKTVSRQMREDCLTYSSTLKTGGTPEVTYDNVCISHNPGDLVVYAKTMVIYATTKLTISKIWCKLLKLNQSSNLKKVLFLISRNRNIKKSFVAITNSEHSV